MGGEKPQLYLSNKYYYWGLVLRVFSTLFFQFNFSILGDFFVQLVPNSSLWSTFYYGYWANYIIIIDSEWSQMKYDFPMFKNWKRNNQKWKYLTSKLDLHLRNVSCILPSFMLAVSQCPLCPPTPQGPRVPPPSLVNRSTTAYTPHYRLTRASPYTGARTPGWATPLVTPVLGYSTVLYCTVLCWDEPRPVRAAAAPRQPQERRHSQ